jgi:hypothetical protein
MRTLDIGHWQACMLTHLQTRREPSADAVATRSSVTGL